MSKELDPPNQLAEELLEFLTDKQLSIQIVAEASCIFIVGVITTMMNNEKDEDGRNKVKDGMNKVINGYMANAEENHKEFIKLKGEAEMAAPEVDPFVSAKVAVTK